MSFSFGLLLLTAGASLFGLATKTSEDLALSLEVRGGAGNHPERLTATEHGYLTHPSYDVVLSYIRGRASPRIARRLLQNAMPQSRRRTETSSPFSQALGRGQLWRLLTAPLAFGSVGELLSGGILLFQLRVFERLWGAGKYGAFVLAALALSTAAQLAAAAAVNAAAGRGAAQRLAAGPYGVIFASLVWYATDIPPSSTFSLAGLPLSDKTVLWLGDTAGPAASLASRLFPLSALYPGRSLSLRCHSLLLARSLAPLPQKNAPARSGAAAGLLQRPGVAAAGRRRPSRGRRAPGGPAGAAAAPRAGGERGRSSRGGLCTRYYHELC